jgi:hypothetical protein
MVGVTTAPKGWHPYARAQLFVFPPPLVGAELGRVCVCVCVCVCVMAAVFCGCPAVDF